MDVRRRVISGQPGAGVAVEDLCGWKLRGSSLEHDQLVVRWQWRIGMVPAVQNEVHALHSFWRRGLFSGKSGYLLQSRWRGELR